MSNIDEINTSSTSKILQMIGLSLGCFHHAVKNCLMDEIGLKSP